MVKLEAGWDVESESLVQESNFYELCALLKQCRRAFAAAEFILKL